MDAAVSRTGAYTVLRLGGRIDVTHGSQIRSLLSKTLAADCEVVVCDLSAVAALDPSGVSLFSAMQWAMPWPGPEFWLAGARGEAAEVLREAGAERFLAVADTLEEALTQCRSEQPVLREALRLSGTTLAPGEARRFVRETLKRWHRPGPYDDAVLVVSELVTNLVLHGSTDVEVLIALEGGLLRLGVRDLYAGLPTTAWVKASQPLDESDRGLGHVRLLAAASGQVPLSGDGKLLWATLRADEGASDEGSLSPAWRYASAPVTESVVINLRRVPQSPRAGWSVRLELEWRPERPDRVGITLSSRPDHPALPRGRWQVDRQTLEDGMRRPVREGSVRIRPDVRRDAVLFELRSARWTRSGRVPVTRLQRFLDATEEATRS